jgi:hypothetical protein
MSKLSEVELLFGHVNEATARVVPRLPLRASGPHGHPLLDRVQRQARLPR